MRIPSSTYRLQLTPSFGFKDVKSVLGYLVDLGITDLYMSPIFKARKGSTHGYDVIDPGELNTELGDETDFKDLACAVREHSMGWLQDIVPNHMAFDSENRMLMDVLENGSASRYYNYFDVDWNHPYESMHGKILAPFLGKFYGECLEEGEIQLRYDQNGLSVNYYDLRLPLKIESYSKVFAHNLHALKNSLGRTHPDVVKFLGALYALKNIPSTDDQRERTDQNAFVKGLLWELYTTNPKVQEFIEENLQMINGRKGDPGSFAMLDELLSEQNFRLAFWKVATEEINYRRFFNINQLICLRVEDQEVFHATHRSMIRLAQEGVFTGLRVDHIDGLYDPKAYLRRLRESCGDIYLTVEKILHPEEELPAAWPVQGTTGYDFLSNVNAVLCERKTEKQFENIYNRYTKSLVPYDVLVTDKKRMMIGRHMAGDIDGLAHIMKSVISLDRYARDITMFGLRRALVEVLAMFPVYRTYITESTYDESDRRYVQSAIARARQTNPALARELAFIEKFLLMQFGDGVSPTEKKRWTHFVMRFQQFTGPLMAKGFEDTALYIYNRLISLNDVGGSPNKFGISPLELHHFNKRRANQWPHSMNATSTHDTKRGEDVRARISVLSELPDEWQRKLNLWKKLNRHYRTVINGSEVPDANDEYFFYQTLIGVYPFRQEEHAGLTERVKGYVIKAVREAKVHTAWLKPDDAYETGFMRFVEQALEVSARNQFLQDFVPFQKKVAHYGILNSLTQTLLKLTSPGVPDFYQGSELWDLNLVDPDNRRPVDFDLLQRFLQELRREEKHGLHDLVRKVLDAREEGKIKMFTILRVLRARNGQKDLFASGEYLPLKVSGRHKNHIIAFARHLENSWSVTVAPRRFVPLVKPDELPLGEAVWEDTVVELTENSPSEWKDIFLDRSIKSNGALSVAEVCNEFPLGLLMSP